ncbi:MAG: (Fe-S)-binding protein [Patescibacteria group bacterium]
MFKLFRGNILYYPGCLTKFVVKDLLDNYRQILRQLKIDFIELAGIEACCGSPALKAGYFDDFQKLAEKNLKIFKEHSVSKIITNCPACFMIFSKEYPKILGEKWDIQIEHITQTIAKKNESWKLKIENSDRQAVSYHDPCHLGRQMGVYDEPREIIRLLGYEIKEMKLNRIDSFCCGGGGGVKSNEPELANQIAQDRLKQAEQTGVKILVTTCPLCYLHLKENTKDIEIKELSQLLNRY